MQAGRAEHVHVFRPALLGTSTQNVTTIDNDWMTILINHLRAIQISHLRGLSDASDERSVYECGLRYQKNYGN